MAEIWKPVVGYEDLYEVSNLGRCKRIKTQNGRPINRLLKVHIRKAGYLDYNLCKDGVPCKRLVSRLVASAFIRDIGDDDVVIHKDKNI